MLRHARLDQRGHQRQLLRQPALLGLLAPSRRRSAPWARRRRGTGSLRRVGGRGRHVGRAATGRLHRRGRRRLDGPPPGVSTAAGRRARRRAARDAARPAAPSPPMRMNLTLASAVVPRDAHHRVLVVALQRGELAALDLAGEEADVAVGAEVLLAAPVVGDDVAGARVRSALTIWRSLVPASAALTHVCTAGPAAAVHLVAALLQRPGHEARAPRVAGRDPGRGEVLVDLGAGVDALLVDALGELALRDLQGGGAEAARAARRRRRGVGHDGRHRGRRRAARSPARPGAAMNASSSPPFGAASRRPRP